MVTERLQEYGLEKQSAHRYAQLIEREMNRKSSEVEENAVLTVKAGVSHERWLSTELEWDKGDSSRQHRTGNDAIIGM